MLSLHCTGQLMSRERPFALLPALPLVLGVIYRVGLARLHNPQAHR